MEEQPQITEPRAIEVALESLSRVLDEARELSSILLQKASILESFDNGQAQKCKGDDEVRKEGHIPRLFELIESLKDVNQINQESLKHINTLL